MKSPSLINWAIFSLSYFLRSPRTDIKGLGQNSTSLKHQAEGKPLRSGVLNWLNFIPVLLLNLTEIICYLNKNVI